MYHTCCHKDGQICVFMAFFLPQPLGWNVLGNINIFAFWIFPQHLDDEIIWKLS